MPHERRRRHKKYSQPRAYIEPRREGRDSYAEHERWIREGMIEDEHIRARHPKTRRKR
jgi:hypothetical protein